MNEKEQIEFFVKRILLVVQELEELGGPDKLETYVAILEAVKENIEQRIGNAQATIEIQETKEIKRFNPEFRQTPYNKAEEDSLTVELVENVELPIVMEI